MVVHEIMNYLWNGKMLNVLEPMTQMDVPVQIDYKDKV
jgi:hypothetical protein